MRIEYLRNRAMRSHTRGESRIHSGTRAFREALLRASIGRTLPAASGNSSAQANWCYRARVCQNGEGVA